MKDLNDMTRKDFEALPHRKWDEIIECDSIIILPGKPKDLHDSGYRCMDFVACNKGEAMCLLSGCSDVVHLDGIGGYGHNWYMKREGVPKMVIPKGWAIDCLPRSGLLRLWCDRSNLLCDPALASFAVYAIRSEG